MAHQSAKPCGCDEGAGWICEDHRFINSVILETVAQLDKTRHDDELAEARWAAEGGVAVDRARVACIRHGLISLPDLTVGDIEVTIEVGPTVNFEIPIPEFAERVNRELGIQPEWHCQCLDCGWRGLDTKLLAQACPVCDGRVADV